MARQNRESPAPGGGPYDAQYGNDDANDRDKR
jgi:hypothetical protein